MERMLQHAWSVAKVLEFPVDCQSETGHYRFSENCFGTFTFLAVLSFFFKSPGVESEKISHSISFRSICWTCDIVRLLAFHVFVSDSCGTFRCGG